MTFNPGNAAAAAASAEFRFVDATCATVGCGVAPAGTQSTPYALHGVDWAHSAGLTGSGKTVAVVDSGFLTTHREFNGKSIQSTGTLPVSGHGTLVASLVAGNKDGQGMHGVAPGANLHLTSITPNGSFDIANVAAGTRAAAALGAVAQNNSWGFDRKAELLRDYLASHPGASTAAGMASVVGYGTANWQSYIDALDDFQRTGVIVWALSNDSSFANGDVTATLPYFEPRLSEAWIAAANGYFEVNGAGDITRAVRLSAACGLAARFCIAGDGIVSGAWNSSDTSYASGYGTSFVAPQIAGSVALLAEAFPDLTPEEWTKRLLASADNSWFSAQGVPVAGTVDFGNGVTHAYSTEWGHGVIDLKAALSPIGSVAVLNGATVSQATRYPVRDAAIVTPNSFGDALTRALEPQQIAVFDALNRAYPISTAVAVSPRQVDLLPKITAEPALAKAGLSIERTTNLATATGAFSNSGAKSSVLALGGESLLIASTAPLGSTAGLTAYGFVGEHASLASGSLAGGGIAITMPVGLGSLRVGGTIAQEGGGVLGLDGGKAFDFGSGSVLGGLNLGLEQVVLPGVTIFGHAEYGNARRLGGGSGLVSALSNLSFSGFEIGAALNDVVMRDDQLTFSLAQPLLIETGTVELTRAVARMADGSLINQTSSADLKASGRQLNLNLNYTTTLENDAALNLGLLYAIDAGHVAGKQGAGLAMGYSQGF